MLVLVAYATKHGATRGIADRIADTLRRAKVEVTVRPADDPGDLTGYDAFVIGSAAYDRHWRKEAVHFVRDNRLLLAARPVWLFSSGPLGTETRDARGWDRTVAARPADVAQLEEMVSPRDHRVFFGALNPRTLGVTERLIRKLPAARALLPEGDFRDWTAVDAWTTEIAAELASLPATRG